MTNESANLSTKSKKKKLTVDEKLAKLQSENAELERKLKEKDDNTPIRLDEYIEVVSLIPYKLNLSTDKQGKGRSFSFSKFGEVKRILYNDLASIFEHYRSFMEQGYFYILNEKVVRKHGLDDIFDKILSKEKIEEILSFNPDTAVKLYEFANETQRDIIDSMLVKKIKNDEADLNIVAQISKIGKKDLIKIAEEVKAFEALPA